MKLAKKVYLLITKEKRRRRRRRRKKNIEEGIMELLKSYLKEDILKEDCTSFCSTFLFVSFPVFFFVAFQLGGRGGVQEKQSNNKESIHVTVGFIHLHFYSQTNRNCLNQFHSVSYSHAAQLKISYDCLLIANQS